MTTPAFDLRPLMVANMACSMSMMAFVSLIGPIARVLGLATWQAGAAVTVSGVIWMLLARPWGQASDRYGRRRILLIATAGFTLAYWALCLFIDASLRFLPSALLGFIGLMIGRGLIGVFYAAIPVGGNALIADNIEPQHRAKAMAALGAANACGLVIGPAIAALLSRFSLSLPFYAMAILPLLAFVVLHYKLKGQELHLRQAPRKVHLNDPRLRRPMAVAFVAMLCVSIAQITVGFFALDRLGMNPADAAQTAGIALTMVGFALICSQLLVRRLEWPPLRLIRAGALVAAVGFAGSILADAAWGLWLCFFVSAGGMGLIFPSFAALAANAVDASEQGATAGSIGAAQGFGVVIGPLAATLIYDVDPRLPYLVAAALLLLVALWPQTRQH
ncbi:MULTISPECIES: MFS transporter [Pseudomonas]|jgi:MFS family permease|uniref:Predicted arabinose efflux permease, MFS family n=1 Tax=Pseudomonas mandelii TaxID=75612 RepID=A0ABY0W0B0_9PSED|nr:MULTISPECIES: MFS transporter [Pseudomonas]MBU0525170.1 MFS transporter [Gammaproteobacteria bacterium]MDF9881217.1 MFS family permease [Pseudomonas silensiensis]MBU0822251.1 MFS transporter [Gammaproteobacteria bacterium]MBU0840133.1 MFS transporter [Gammaproteobacteria bacterium]MBU1842615.1 MFS transporter [Gammaproteobacteria bacterium]